MSDTSSTTATTSLPDGNDIDDDEPSTESEIAVKPIKPLTLVRNLTGLLVAPIVIAVVGYWLFNYGKGPHEDFTIERSLQWDLQLKPQIQQHLAITMWSTLAVLVIAIPLGVFLTRPRYRRIGAPILTIATSGQAIPAFGLLILALALIGQGAWTVVWSLTLFTLLPVLRNTMVGLDQVSSAVIEAGRGMGLTKFQTLRQIELPLAVPVILAGARTALVINVGMATLAFLVGGGGLGITINSGLELSRDKVLIVGAVLTALIALAVDWLAAIIERVLRPRGL